MYPVKQGRLPLVKWVQETFAFSQEEIRADKNPLVLRAAQKNHRDVLEYLFQEFALTKGDVYVCVAQMRPSRVGFTNFELSLIHFIHSCVVVVKK